MTNKRMVEGAVGSFLLVALMALFVLAIKVSGLSMMLDKEHTYQVTAEFDDIGSLKVKSAVMISGVAIGRVTSVVLDPKTFQARVSMAIDQAHNQLPVDTQASILTKGLLGSNYISLSPGYAQAVLKNGDRISVTHSALVLEHIIGQMLYSIRSDKK